jgi:hypothetical protein
MRKIKNTVKMRDLLEVFKPTPATPIPAGQEPKPMSWYYEAEKYKSRYPLLRGAIPGPMTSHPWYCKSDFLKNRSGLGVSLGQAWRSLDRDIDLILVTDLAFEVFLGHWKSVENHIHKTPPQVYLSTLD